MSEITNPKKDKKSYPSHVYVQKFDNGLPPESQLVHDEMKSRSVPITSFSVEKIVFHGLPLEKTELVVGDFKCTKKAMKILSIPIPEPPDYPKCITDLLHRKIWKTTLGKVGSEMGDWQSPVFVKPSIHSKLFSGLILNKDWLSYLLSNHPKDTEIYCSEVVKFVSEYRVYVVKGEIKGVCHYAGDKTKKLDMEVVKKAVKEFSSKGYKGRIYHGYGIDFGIIKKEIVGKDKKKEEKDVTALIEVNDAISLGYYKGVSQKDYTEMVLVRWEQLLKTIK